MQATTGILGDGRCPLSIPPGLPGALTAGCVLLALLPGSAGARILPAAIKGTLNITAVSSEIDSSGSGTLRQEYTAGWKREITPYVSFKSRIRYYKFDLQRDRSESAWQEEFQPSGDLSWKHPYFSFGTSVLRRSAKARNSLNNQISDNLQFTFRTRDTRLPILTLRYDRQHIFDQSALEDRDTRDSRLQAGLNYTRRASSATYNFSSRRSNNVISGLSGVSRDHMFRWAGLRSGNKDGGLSVGAHYTYNRGYRRDRVIGAGALLEKLPLAAGLFVEDGSPEFGTLPPSLGLIDGNLSAPAQPPIEIGGTSIERNIGADIGFVRRVDALYVYTDVASGTGVLWSVYVSPDNVIWQLWSGAPAAVYSSALNRYELVFNGVDTRYIKVVNGGLNNVGAVQVTEIELFQEIPSVQEEERRRDSHLADLRLSYRLTQRLGMVSEISYQHHSSQRNLGTQDNVDYALRASFEQTEVVTHHLKWEQAYQTFSGDVQDLQNSSASYTLLLNFLDTLRGSASISSRIGFVGGLKTQEVNGFLGELRGTPIGGLDVTTGLSRSRSHQYDIGARSDLWSYRVGMNGALTRTLDATVNFTQQIAESRDDGPIRSRRLVALSFNYRVTRSVYSRGTFNFVDDVSNSLTHDYLLSWSASPKLSISGQAYFTSALADFNTQRYSFNATYDINNRSKLYLRASLDDFSGAGGNRTFSLQQGIRAGF